jgi:hypothetical protein
LCPNGSLLQQLFLSRIPGRSYSRLYAPTLAQDFQLFLTLHTRFPFACPVACENQMGVGINEGRHYNLLGCINDIFVGGCELICDPWCGINSRDLTVNYCNGTIGDNTGSSLSNSFGCRSRETLACNQFSGVNY